MFIFFLVNVECMSTIVDRPMLVKDPRMLLVHRIRVSEITTNLTPQLIRRLYKLSVIIILHSNVPQITSLLIYNQCGLESLCKQCRVCIELLE